MTDYERIKREFDLSLLSKLAQTVRQLPTVEDLWPVGSIYMSLDPTDPATRFGGVWERIENAFLLAASSAHPAGERGGEETHRLTVNEMPKHSHPAYMNYWSGGSDTIPQWRWYFNDSAYAEAGTNKANGRRANYLTQVEGGDQPHNNMPPYLSVYMWKRTK